MNDTENRRIVPNDTARTSVNVYCVQHMANYRRAGARNSGIWVIKGVIECDGTDCSESFGAVLRSMRPALHGLRPWFEGAAKLRFNVQAKVQARVQEAQLGEGVA